MTPAEAAALLGLAADASEDEIHAAYQQRAAALTAGDAARADGLTAARDALLAAQRWQPKGDAALPPVAGAASVPGTPMPPVPPAAPSIPPTPVPPVESGPPQPGSYPNPPAPQPPSPPAGPLPTVPSPQGAPPHASGPFVAAPAAPPPPGFPPVGPPAAYGAVPSAVPTQQQYAQQQYPPQQGYGGYPPVTPPRRGLSTGAIVGIVLGGAGLLVVIAVIAIVAIVFGVMRDSGGGTVAGPVPSATPWADDSGDDYDDSNDYLIDGVNVHYVDGWTFELTSDRNCAAARVEFGFADTSDGDSSDVQSKVVSLKKGVPFTFTIPDDASDMSYVSIDDIICEAT